MQNLPISLLPKATTGYSDSLMVIVNYNTVSSGQTESIPFSALTSNGTSGTSGSSGESGTSGVNGVSGGQSLFFNTSVTLSPYFELSPFGDTQVETGVTVSVSAQTEEVIASYQTPVGYPNSIIIPPGVWSFYLHGYKQNQNAIFDIFCDVYKRDTGGTETLLFTTDPVAVTTNSPNVAMYVTDVYQSGSTLNVSDRLVVKVMGRNKTLFNQPYSLTFITQGLSHYSYGTTTLNYLGGTSGTSGSSGISGTSGTDGSSGTSGVVPTIGSWTLSAGTNTVSFTVTAGQSYVMWVNGNIPNGIVNWNATVTLSNSNVPVIGTQYGWYYLAGNALVLTSIPSQIVGTAGSISTSAPSGSNSNTFTFGITNNSGTSQIVYYGYLKVS